MLNERERRVEHVDELSESQVPIQLERAVTEESADVGVHGVKRVPMLA